MSTFSPEELDRQAAGRHADRFVPQADPLAIKAAEGLEPLIVRELGIAAQGLPREARSALAAVRVALAEARTAENGLSAAYGAVARANPSDREHLRRQADERGTWVVDAAYDKARAALVVLEADLAAAAIPPVPDDASDARDELRMLLEGKASKDQLLQIALEQRYAGLMAGAFGRAYLRSVGHSMPHDTLRKAIAAKYGKTTHSVATAKAIAASRAAGSHRLRAAGVTR